MHFFVPALVAIAMGQKTTALAIAAEEPPVPNLPNGFFAGYNNPDGTNTLHFVDVEKEVTFLSREAPKPEESISPAEEADQSPNKRQFWSPVPDQVECWYRDYLDRAGTDAAIAEMRARLKHTPIGVGQFSDWLPYFGYNHNGVYVYFCVNSGIARSYRYFEEAGLDWASRGMDVSCEPYMAGYYRFADTGTATSFGESAGVAPKSAMEIIDLRR